MKNEFLKRATVGSWITIGHPMVAEIMGRAGFDWLAVDLEHSAITLREAEDLIRIIDLNNVTPFVRLTSSNPDQIKRVLDSGAYGVIVPMVNTKATAEAVVGAVKYPPQGSRSFGLARAQGYGHQFDKYISWNQSGSMVIVQVEHVDAVKNLEEILSVEGVDGYFVGPYDLSGSLGIPGQFSNPLFISAMEEIRRIGKEVGKPGGMHVIEPSESSLNQAIEEGYQFIAYSLDFKFLDTGCRKGLRLWSER